MIFFAVCKCSRLCVNFHVGTFQVCTRLLAKLEFPAQTPDKSRLKFLGK